MIVLNKEVKDLEVNENVVVQGLLILKKDFGKYIDLVLDDFTEILTVRCFDIDLSNIEEGDFVTVYGYIKEYNETKRVYAKKVFKLKESDYFYWKVRLFKEKNEKLELEKSQLTKAIEKEKEEKSEESEASIDVDVENIDVEVESVSDNISNDLKNEILKIIKEHKEIKVDDLYQIAKEKLKIDKEQVDQILEEIADEIFEPKPGVIKIIEI